MAACVVDRLGKTAPSCLLVGAVDPEARIHVTREAYKTRLRPDVLGKTAKGWIDSGVEPRPVAIVCDHDEERKADFEKASGLHVDLADKRDRDKGIEALQARFDVADDGRARVFFREGMRDHPADRYLIDAGRPTCCLEELVGYVWDPDFLADEPIAENDHAMDSLRYLARHVDANFGSLVAPVMDDHEPLLPENYGEVGSATGW